MGKKPADIDYKSDVGLTINLDGESNPEEMDAEEDEIEAV